MKVIRSQRREINIKVPVRGGYLVQGSNHRAVVHNEVAEFLAGLGGFYSIESDVADAIQEGTQVLVIRDCNIGDILLMTPLIRGLARDKGAIVDVATNEGCRCLLDGNPYVRQTFALEKEKDIDTSAYPVVIDLRLVVENAERVGVRQHRVDAFGEYGDVRFFSLEERHLDYFVTPEEQTTIQERLATVKKQARPDGSLPSIIGYVWRSTTANRNWSEATHRAVLAALLEASYIVVLIDHQPVGRAIAAELSHHNLIDWTGTMQLREVGALIDACDAIVTPDTGMFHLAGALNKPTITYFGSFPVEERHTHQQLRIVNNPKVCPRSACYEYGCLNKNENGQARCLAVDPATVVDRLEDLLNAAIVERSTANSDPETEDNDLFRAEYPAGELGDDPGTGDPGQHSAVQGIARKPGRRRSALGNARSLLQPENKAV